MLLLVLYLESGKTLFVDVNYKHRDITLISENLQVGHYKVEWDASQMASSVYYYLIIAGEFQEVKKMILIR